MRAALALALLALLAHPAAADNHTSGIVDIARATGDLAKSVPGTGASLVATTGDATVALARWAEGEVGRGYTSLVRQLEPILRP